MGFTYLAILRRPKRHYTWEAGELWEKVYYIAVDTA